MASEKKKVNAEWGETIHVNVAGGKKGLTRHTLTKKIVNMASGKKKG